MTFGEAKRRLIEDWIGDQQDEITHFFPRRDGNSYCLHDIPMVVLLVNLRKFAQGKDCHLRIPGICNFDPETTSLAHLRMPGITGGGQKSPDLLGAWACSKCAAQTENGYARDDSDKVAFFEGVMRTQYELVKMNVLKW